MINIGNINGSTNIRIGGNINVSGDFVGGDLIKDSKIVIG